LKSPPNDATNFSSILSKGHNMSREKKKRKEKEKSCYTYLLTANSGTLDSSSSSALKYSEYPPPLPNYTKR
jgi:hypothetical protein